MVNHGAFDPTKMWWVGRMAGASVNVPIATWTNSPSRTTEKRTDPHAAQWVSLASASPKISSASFPLVTANLCRSIPAKDLNAAPVVLRQLLQ